MAAWRTLSVGDRVGALVFNDSEIREIPPHRSRQRVIRILETVVEMNHALRVNEDIEPNPAILNRVLERVLHLAKHDYLVAMISDFNVADGGTRSAVTRLAAHNDVLALFVYDPLEAGLPSCGKLIVSQGDLHLEVDTRDTQFRRRVSDQFEGRLKTARHLMLKRGIPVLAIHTAEGVREQFMELLGHRPMNVRK